MRKIIYNRIINVGETRLDEEYYRFTLDNSRLYYSIRIAQTEALICLKAKAFLDLTKRRSAGEEIDSRNIRKHNLDIFRLATLLRVFKMPGILIKICSVLQIKQVKNFLAIKFLKTWGCLRFMLNNSVNSSSKTLI